MEKTIYDYIVQEEASYKTVRVPITGNIDWNMHEHIERCTNVSNGWYHSGGNDGTRPYKDIVTPIINVAIRSEGFDVKDIVPFVNDADNYYKSFLVKKYHPQWARKNEIDTFIDEMVESSVVYDLALIKNCNNVRPEVVPLQEIAFCDQTNVLSGPLCLKHMYSPAELSEYAGKWDADKVEEAIIMAKAEKTVNQAGDQKAKTPGKYIEVYELHGMLPEHWLDPEGDMTKFVPQMQIIAFYKDAKGNKNGITLFKGLERKPIFKALVLKPVFGRACGRSIVESLFEPQVWTNYSEIRIKELLDAAAVVLFQTDDDEYKNQKLSKLKNNTILGHSQGKPITKMDTTVPNIVAFENHGVALENSARAIGSANDAQLGINPSSGTPFKLQDLVVSEGQGIHEYRQGKIATFTSDQLYRDWILQYLVNEMNNGKKFSEELTMDELSTIADIIATNEIQKRVKQKILDTGDVPTVEDRMQMMEVFKKDFLKKGSRRFFEVLKEELKGLPVDVYVNINQKQRKMTQNADKISNILMKVLANPMAFKQAPGLGKAFNELLEESGMSAIDFSQITELVPEAKAEPVPVPSPVGGGGLPVPAVA